MKSPCVKICKLRDNYCIGCYRSVDEITNWKDFTNDKKLAVYLEIYLRKNQKNIEKISTEE